jgi:uncharacterized protein
MSFTSFVFENEGNDNLEETTRIVAEFATVHHVDTIITFTALGEGALRIRQLLPSPEARIVAVTFPAESFAIDAGSRISLGVPDPNVREKLRSFDIPIVQAAMPFRGFDARARSSTARVVNQALAVFGGGINLCVQAVLMACDAGYIETEQRCIAFSGDTAILARAAHTHSFLSERSRFAVEHILCKPLQYQITRTGIHASAPKRVTETVEAKPFEALTSAEGVDADELPDAFDS